jgi:hypothetical protein
MLFNPFRPNSLIPTGLFTGRYDESVALENMLFNTLNGNPQHFLLHGERGIGKSSLLFIHETTAKGRIKAFDGRTFNFLVVSLNLDSNDTYESVIDKLGQGLKLTCAAASKGKEFLKTAWDFLSRFEAAGIKLRPAETGDPHTPLMNLVHAYANSCEDIKGFYDGILILIDEADKAPVAAQLGSILKTLTERVSRSDNSVLAIGLAGVSSLLSVLRESHESSPRLFTCFDLKPLSDDETKQVIRKSLQDAAEKNGVTTSIAPDAEDMIVKLSEGYPNFIQEFGFFAFKADTDLMITCDDVQAGAWSEHGAFAQLGAKYFKHLYFGKISSDNYRQLLQTMATHEDAWITKEQLRSEAGLSETILTNALQALLTRKIILSREGKKGHYRLPSKSFSAWLRAYKMRDTSIAQLADPWILGEEDK